jgi:hypothetical protein
VTALSIAPAAKSQAEIEAGRNGYRLAENTHWNIGFFIRPDDHLSFTPTDVFRSATDAWEAHGRESK